MRQRLAEFLGGPGPTAIVGVGNEDRGDDGFGPAVVALLDQELGDVKGPAAPVVLIDAGIRPENCLEAVAAAGAARVLFVDAAATAHRPMTPSHRTGHPRLIWLEPGELVGTSVSSHRLPLPLVAALLRTETQAAEAAVLAYPIEGGEAATPRFSPLSAAGRAAAEEAAELLAGELRRRRDGNRPGGDGPPRHA
ncbi:MAG: hydrogenase maturation protease [Bacillota bacterium]